MGKLLLLLKSTILLYTFFIFASDYKYNFTLSNCSLTLCNKEREVLVMTMSQLLSSVERNPGTNTYKVSVRIESMAIEGASVENELVPLLTTDNILTGNTTQNFLALDFEKNPGSSDFDYDLSTYLGSIEITCHNVIISQTYNYFKFIYPFYHQYNY